MNIYQNFTNTLESLSIQIVQWLDMSERLFRPVIGPNKQLGSLNFALIPVSVKRF
ncbi:hypothetical protein [Rudanella paleaurantiibacter]|uniref:hypothetical protein n=1 Tax=Rudanella paleaurantiibacter TaxID=2614655 RepID=UPI0016293F3E|nr:hypothetical protein [Rudanella paleaurantiibacter]